MPISMSRALASCEGPRQRASHAYGPFVFGLYRLRSESARGKVSLSYSVLLASVFAGHCFLLSFLQPSRVTGSSWHLEAARCVASGPPRGVVAVLLVVGPSHEARALLTEIGMACPLPSHRTANVKTLAIPGMACPLPARLPENL